MKIIETQEIFLALILVYIYSVFLRRSTYLLRTTTEQNVPIDANANVESQRQFRYAR